MRGTDRERGRAVGVAQDHANPFAPDAGVHDLTQRLVAEPGTERARRGLHHGRGRPRPDLMRAGGRVVGLRGGPDGEGANDE